MTWQEASNKMKIIPAIIPQDYLDLHNKLMRVKDLAPLVQIDICDGRLTPKASWPYVNDKENFFQRISDQEEGLPMWEVFDFEMDLMVRNPENEFGKWIDAGATRMVIHHAPGHEERILKIAGECKNRGTETIIAFHHDHTMEEVLKSLEKYLPEIMHIQHMGIRQIGFQGQEFEKETIGRVKELAELRVEFPELSISVDGGVNFDTADALADAGADTLVVGSALFEGDIAENYDYFDSL
jgi:ribulose-phosphate 3-epimerase